jgi:hypothetical protein
VAHGRLLHPPERAFPRVTVLLRRPTSCGAGMVRFGCVPLPLEHLCAAPDTQPAVTPRRMRDRICSASAGRCLWDCGSWPARPGRKNAAPRYSHRDHETHSIISLGQIRKESSANATAGGIRRCHFPSLP